MAPSIDNAVISNVLCFISTSRHIMNENSILASCLSFYNGDSIFKAKEILCSCIGETIVRRQGANKVKSNIEDILLMMKTCDDAEKELPKFLCDGYAQMPPGSGFEVLAEHIIGLVTEVAAMKEELKALKSQPRGSNNSRNSVSASGMRSEGLYSQAAQNGNNGKQKSTVQQTVQQIEEIPDHRQGGQSSTSKDSRASSSKSHIPHSHEDKFLVLRNGKESVDFNSKENGHFQWNLVQNKRARNTVKGSKTSSGSLKGVQDSRDLYVGRCDPQVSDEDLIKYVKEDLKIHVIACKAISKDEAPVKAFKLTTRAEDSEKLLDATLWPEYIRVRKFFMKSNVTRTNHSQ